MKAIILNKTLKKLLCLCLVTVIVTGMLACKKEEVVLPEEVSQSTESAEIPDGVITVAYSTLDSLNPFFSQSLLNASLFSLLYRSLFTLNTGFTPQADLATGQTVSPTVIKVTLNENLLFSDGTQLSSADVVYSFDKAKDSFLYGESLTDFDSCVADGAYNAVFTLKQADVNALNVLTFPIVKNGTAQAQDAIPVGNGAYRYQQDELRPYLTLNTNYDGQKPLIGTVRLCDVNISSSLMHLLDTSIIDCFFTDLSDGTSKRTYSGTGEVYLNNLVYLGFNENSYRLNTADMRKAVSLCIDRRAIVENAYLSHARASDVPVNISWDELNACGYLNALSGNADVTQANALLEDFAMGVEGDKAYYTMICPDAGSFAINAAKQIATQLENINLYIEVKVLSADKYELALQNGDYDMYLGEIKLSKNMDLSAFFTPEGKANYGLNLEALSIDESYFAYRAGDMDLKDFLTLFSQSVPIVPICYRNGQFCYSRNISGVMECTENNLYGTVSQWSVK